MESLDGSRYIRVASLFVFYCTLFPEIGSNEKKILKEQWDVAKYIPLVHLYGNVTWDSCSFFTEMISKFVAAAKLPNLASKRGDYLSNLVQSFPQYVIVI